MSGDEPGEGHSEPGEAGKGAGSPVGASTPRGVGPVRRPFALGVRAPRRVIEPPKPRRIGQPRSASRSGGWGRIAEESDDEHDVPATGEAATGNGAQPRANPQDEPAAEPPVQASADVTITDVDSRVPPLHDEEAGGMPAAMIPKHPLQETCLDSESAHDTERGERVDRAEGASHHGMTVIRPRQVGRYNLVEELGRGGLGVIHLAHDDTLRRDLAIKVLRNPANSKHRESFVEEAQITGQLEHPNVVPVHELGFDEHGGPYLAMKRVRGHSLRELIEKQKKRLRAPTQSELVRQLDIFRKVCNAIAFAHDHGVIHRDLKPENIMVGEYGEVMVMDWGLAKPLRDGPGYRGFAGNRTAVRAVETVHTDRRDHQGMHLTAMGQLMGTPAYMAPEQARGASEEVDRRTDIFALGGLLYHMLTGEPPYLGTALSEVLIAASKADVMPPRKRAPQMQVPRELEAVVMKAMAAEPRNRYRSVSDLRDDIDAFLSNEPLRAYQDSWSESLAKWGRRHPTQMTLFGMGILFLAMVLLAAFALRELQITGEERERQHELDRAQADARLAEARQREAEIRERVAAEAAERARLEAAAEEARIRNLAQQGQIEMLLRDLVGEGASERELTVQEFRVRVRSARALGMAQPRVIEHLEREQYERYRAALEQHLAEAPAPGKEEKAQAAEHRYLYALLLAYGPESEVEPAIAALDQALAEAEDQARYWYIRGRLHRKIGADPHAEADWRTAVRLEATLLEAHLALGRLALEEREYWAAAERFGRVLESEEGNVDARAGRGFALVQLGEHEAGSELLAEAMERAPQNPHANLYRAILKQEAGKLDEALPYATAAVTLDPDEPWAYLVRGAILREQGALDRALVDLSQAVRLDPYRARAVFRRGLLHLQRGQEEVALADFDEAIARNAEHGGAYLERARLHAANERYASAAEDAATATRLMAESYRAWLTRAEIAAVQQETQAARDAYERAEALADSREAQQAVLTSRKHHLDE